MTEQIICNKCSKIILPIFSDGHTQRIGYEVGFIEIGEYANKKRIHFCCKQCLIGWLKEQDEIS